LDDIDDTVQCRDMPVVGGQPACEFPDAFDGIELGTVWWQEHQRERLAMPVQKGTECTGVVVPGVVPYHDQAFVARAMLEQSFQKSLERVGVEFWLEGYDQSAGMHVDRSEAGNRRAGGRMEQDGVFRLRGHPHATARAMLLEVALGLSSFPCN